MLYIFDTSQRSRNYVGYVTREVVDIDEHRDENENTQQTLSKMNYTRVNTECGWPSGPSAIKSQRANAHLLDCWNDVHTPLVSSLSACNRRRDHPYHCRFKHIMDVRRARRLPASQISPIVCPVRYYSYYGRYVILGHVQSRCFIECMLWAV